MNFDGDDLKRRLLENGKLMNGSEIYKTLVKYKRYVDQTNPTYSKVVVQFMDFDENLKSEYKSLNKVRINLIQLIDTIKLNQENPGNLDNDLISNAQLIQDAMNNLVDLSYLIDGIELFKGGLNLTSKKDAYSYTDNEKKTIRSYNQCIESLKRCIDYQNYIEERLGDLKKEIKEQQKTTGIKIPEEGNLKNSVIKSRSVIAAKLEEYEKRMVHLNEEIKATSSNPVSNSTTINSCLFTDKWKTEIDDIDRRLAKYTNKLDIKVFFIEQKKKITSHKVVLYFNDSILGLRYNRPSKIFAIIFDEYDKIDCDLKSLDNKVKPNTELYLFTGKKNKSKMMCSERLRNLKIVSATYEDAQSMLDALCNEIEKSLEVKTDNSAEELKYLAIEKEMNEGLIKALKPIMDKEDKREKETEKAKDKRAEKLHSQAQLAKIQIEKLEFECDGLREKSDEVAKEIEKFESFLNNLNPCVNKIEEEKQKRIEAVKNTDQEMYTFEEKLVDILEYLELLGDRRRAVIKGLNELNNFINDIQYQFIYVQDWEQTKLQLKDRDDFREILQLFYITPFTEGQKHNF